MIFFLVQTMHVFLIQCLFPCAFRSHFSFNSATCSFILQVCGPPMTILNVLERDIRIHVDQRHSWLFGCLVPGSSRLEGVQTQNIAWRSTIKGTHVHSLCFCQFLDGVYAEINTTTISLILSWAVGQTWEVFSAYVGKCICSQLRC